MRKPREGGVVGEKKGCEKVKGTGKKAKRRGAETQAKRMGGGG